MQCGSMSAIYTITNYKENFKLKCLPVGVEDEYGDELDHAVQRHVFEHSKAAHKLPLYNFSKQFKIYKNFKITGR
jgi:hypothetical protein